MKKFLSFLFLVLPMIMLGQNVKRTTVGVNLAPLFLNAIELSVEQQVSKVFNIRGAAGFRLQSKENGDPLFLATPMGDYMNQRNQGYFFSLGGKFMDHKVNETPYFRFEGIGIGYSERIVTEYDFQTGEILRMEDFDGFRWGASGTLGFMMGIWNRGLILDLGLQAGYSGPFREEEKSYYLSGLGYSMFGYGILSVKGLHLQPVIGLQYHIRGNKRKAATID